MKRVLAVLVGAGVAVGGGVAAWAGPGGGPHREAAKACAAEAKAADPEIDRPALREAVLDCLEAQGITRKERPPLTPEQEARRAALRTCLQGVMAANPDADRAALREAAKPCLEAAGIDPGRVRNRLAAVKECREEVRGANPDVGRAELRRLVMECVRDR